MKKGLFLVLALVLAFGSVSLAQAGIIENTITYPTGYFADTSDPSSYGNSPYYRWYGEDWSWTHDGLCCKHYTYVDWANLTIQAWDVDQAAGEVDEIYGYNQYLGINPDNTPIPNPSPSWVLLGTLTGSDGAVSDTTFAVPAELLDDVKYGLNVMIEIDVNQGNWAVTLFSSEIEAECLPIPLPGTLLLLGSGLLGLALGRRKLL